MKYKLFVFLIIPGILFTTFLMPFVNTAYAYGDFSSFNWVSSKNNVYVYTPVTPAGTNVDSWQCSFNHDNCIWSANWGNNYQGGRCGDATNYPDSYKCVENGADTWDCCISYVNSPIFFNRMSIPDGYNILKFHILLTVEQGDSCGSSQGSGNFQNYYYLDISDTTGTYHNYDGASSSTIVSDNCVGNQLGQEDVSITLTNPTDEHVQNNEHWFTLGIHDCLITYNGGVNFSNCKTNATPVISIYGLSIDLSSSPRNPFDMFWYWDLLTGWFQSFLSDLDQIANNTLQAANQGLSLSFQPIFDWFLPSSQDQQFIYGTLVNFTSRAPFADMYYFYTDFQSFITGLTDNSSMQSNLTANASLGSYAFVNNFGSFFSNTQSVYQMVQTQFNQIGLTQANLYLIEDVVFTLFILKSIIGDLQGRAKE